MKITKLLLMSALGLTLSAISAQAQETKYDWDRNGRLDSVRTIFRDGTIDTTWYYYDRNGNIDYIKHTPY
jgi:YD repeat-containing protein